MIEKINKITIFLNELKEILEKNEDVESLELETCFEFKDEKLDELLEKTINNLICLMQAKGLEFTHENKELKTLANGSFYMHNYETIKEIELYGSDTFKYKKLKLTTEIL